MGSFARLEQLIDASWAVHLQKAVTSPGFSRLKRFLQSEVDGGKRVYPALCDVFSCFSACPFGSTRVCILGQDPYHQVGQAHGMAFSVLPGVKIPPSLVNMFKEARVANAKHGYLVGWARQGVLLLNACMTVRDSEPNSHRGKGWEQFTDAAISALSKDAPHKIVFMLWGNYARKKVDLIDQRRHVVLQAPHPSPLSAHHGFLGCGHFQTCNDILVADNCPPIQWDHLPTS
eukprot:ANDGO_01256.mRNA.1 Uracil-DNA glycosylase